MITPFYNTALNGLSLIQTGILYSNKHIQYIYFHSLLDMFCSPSEVISNIVFLYIVLVFCFLFFFFCCDKYFRETTGKWNDLFGLPATAFSVHAACSPLSLGLVESVTESRLIFSWCPGNSDETSSS